MIKFLLHGGLTHHPERPDDNHMLGLSSGPLISRPENIVGADVDVLRLPVRPFLYLVPSLVQSVGSFHFAHAFVRWLVLHSLLRKIFKFY